MITLLNQLIGKWERVRQSLSDDLQHIQSAINSNWASVFTKNNTLQPGAIAGSATPATRYVANTGPGNEPNWDQVNLVNGVKGRLPLSSVQAATAGSRLLGRESGSGGNFEEITLGAGLSMAGTVLNSSAGVVWVPLSNGDPTFPEIIFAGGEPIMVQTLTP